MKGSSFARLPSAAVSAACAACIKRIGDADVERDNAALDREIAKRARGWFLGLGAVTWTRDDARRYFNGFTGLDACFNPLVHHASDQLIAARRLLKLATAAEASGVHDVSVTAQDFHHISGFYGGTQHAA